MIIIYRTINACEHHESSSASTIDYNIFRHSIPRDAANRNRKEIQKSIQSLAG